ncbi:MAG: adenylate kinase family enzyme [Alphaproteobacteria bacterium]|jgi:adenylate kinase family enzyme
MRKIIIFGNSGSGKSTLAAQLRNEGLAHLDLDVLAWLPSHPPERRPLDQAYEKIQNFIWRNDEWVVEGCYADLLELVESFANEAVFLNLPVHLCIENAMSRPWEPHKYESQEAQDDNLAMLLDWVAGYMLRTDSLSYIAHSALYDSFQGKKTEILCNEQRHSKVQKKDA